MRKTEFYVLIYEGKEREYNFRKKKTKFVLPKVGSAKAKTLGRRRWLPGTRDLRRLPEAASTAAQNHPRSDSGFCQSARYSGCSGYLTRSKCATKSGAACARIHWLEGRFDG